METAPLVVLVVLICSVNLVPWTESCETAADCPFLYCCVHPKGNSVDNQYRQHQHNAGAVTGRRSEGDVDNDLVDSGRRAVKGTCQTMKAQGQICWTKTDVAYSPPKDMTDDCPCQRGLYCVANGVFLPGGEVGMSAAGENYCQQCYW